MFLENLLRGGMPFVNADLTCIMGMGIRVSDLKFIVGMGIRVSDLTCIVGIRVSELSKRMSMTLDGTSTT